MQIRKHTIDYKMKIAIRNATDIGALIADRRRKLGMNQGQLAVKVGVSRLWVNQIEGGKSGAAVGLVLKALMALDLTISAESAGHAGAPDLEPITSADINAIVANAQRPAR